MGDTRYYHACAPPYLPAILRAFYKDCTLITVCHLLRYHVIIIIVVVVVVPIRCTRIRLSSSPPAATSIVDRTTREEYSRRLVRNNGKNKGKCESNVRFKMTLSSDRQSRNYFLRSKMRKMKICCMFTYIIIDFHFFRFCSGEEVT